MYDKLGSVFSINRGQLITKIYTPLHYRLPGNSSIEALEVALSAACAVWGGHRSSLVINQEGLIRQIFYYCNVSATSLSSGQKNVEDGEMVHEMSQY